MAPSEFSSSTQEPTTVTTCENTETEQNGTEESGFGGERKSNQVGDKGKGAQTSADGNGDDTVEDNIETENTPCTCDTEEETKESDSGDEEKAAEGNGDDTVEDNTQTENTSSTCDTAIEEETEESDSREQENEQNGTEESGFKGGRKALQVRDKGKPTQSTN
ncbi:secreted acidic protein 1A-like isoform X2 [Vigna unguiculata]|uniref:secreted acidic protein 1A-like isoform X2 n=1 Tax=Vigna unguiculata TaxID=3917 RepID=UPI0010169950|nr:secreted acidic protein 1A-like isoform X2 [Vigna unguiculata]